MLDTFQIITATGVVVWSRSYARVPAAAVDRFITDVFIEEKAGGSRLGIPAKNQAATNPLYRHDQYSMKWALAKELGLIFVAVYRSLLHLPWLDQLVDNIRTLFVSLYGEQLKIPHTTRLRCPNFDDYFDQQMRELGATFDATSPPIRIVSAESLDTDPATADKSDTDRPLAVTSSSDLPASQSPMARLSRRQKKAVNAASSGDESSSQRGSKKAAATKNKKKGRKWDTSTGMALDDDSDEHQSLDYSSTTTPKNDADTSTVTPVDASTWGTKTKDGHFVLKDLDNEVHQLLSQAKQSSTPDSDPDGPDSSSAGRGGYIGSVFSGMLRNVLGGKTLTKDDVAPAIQRMEEHLLRKNVAREAAIRLCAGVEAELVGSKTAQFEVSLQKRIREAMEISLAKMLTPTSSLDLLREIDAVTRPTSSLAATFTGSSGRSMSGGARPYVMSIVGVNGVGKSTNLSKIAFFLLQNNYRILVVAGDTFRSGAVEQLAVHVRNLQELAAREGGGRSRIDLYQRGYGKDAAAIAKDAVAFAALPDENDDDKSRRPAYDVVLIDTAGRRHNDTRLMSSLEKFAKFAQPDKILMVGEALVGTDSVAQARNFHAAFGASRGLDGFIISKCDTVGDMVGTLVSLIHATNVPVLFVGVGQHYSDLRNFSVSWAVERLMA